MKLNDNVVVDVDLGESSALQVLREVGPSGETRYQVMVDGVARHPNSGPEDVMRALGNYLQGSAFKPRAAREERPAPLSASKAKKPQR